MSLIAQRQGGNLMSALVSGQMSSFLEPLKEAAKRLGDCGLHVMVRGFPWVSHSQGDEGWKANGQLSKFRS